MGGSCSRGSRGSAPRSSRERAGEAFFAADGLRGLWGGRVEDVIARARRAVGMPARLGAGPTPLHRLRGRRQGAPARQAARAGAAREPRGPLIVSRRAARASSPRCRSRCCGGGSSAGRELPETLERLGIRTLGELAALPRDAVADRFGEPGPAGAGAGQRRRASGCARARRARSSRESLELPEAASGPQLERALELLVDRLLANPARRGRTLRRLRLAARLAGGGGWRVELPLREASASPERLLLALAPKLERAAGPARRLELTALSLGPAAQRQRPLVRDERERRRDQLAEAVRQARAAAGRDAVLRVLEVDPDSRVPERRATLTPFPEPRGRRMSAG